MSLRALVTLAGVLGFTAVALGAFGAHGLRSVVGEGAEAAERLGWWETGARYHLAHALAILGAAFLRTRTEAKSVAVAAVALSIGVLVFSGTLYTMALGGPSGWKRSGEVFDRVHPVSAWSVNALTTRSC